MPGTFVRMDIIPYLVSFEESNLVGRTWEGGGGYDEGLEGECFNQQSH